MSESSQFQPGDIVEFIDHNGKKVCRGRINKGPKGLHRIYVVSVNGPDWYQVPEALMTLYKKV